MCYINKLALPWNISIKLTWFCFKSLDEHGGWKLVFWKDPSYTNAAWLGSSQFQTRLIFLLLSLSYNTGPSITSFSRGTTSSHRGPNKKQWFSLLLPCLVPQRYGPLALLCDETERILISMMEDGSSAPQHLWKDHHTVHVTLLT